MPYLRPFLILVRFYGIPLLKKYQLSNDSNSRIFYQYLSLSNCLCNILSGWLSQMNENSYWNLYRVLHLSMKR